MKIIEVTKKHNLQGGLYPKSLEKINYTSDVDGLKDWALILPGERKDLWIIVLHGHGSRGDQLFIRKDIRKLWLDEFKSSGACILCPNLRGDSWMSPPAAEDLHGLISFLRSGRGLRRAVFCSGSMGGTGNLIYGILHPEDSSGIIARGAAADLEGYYTWCLEQKNTILHEIADAIRTSYGGDPEQKPEIYQKHSVIRHAESLDMPVALSHGEEDMTIPVGQARALASALSEKKDFFYQEIPGGSHDSPLFEKTGFKNVMSRIV
jgi:pimeloyl-ACP methyl ester carboxylesterase